MTASAERVHICGRIRAVAGRRLQSLAAAAGVALTRGTATADTIVLTHGAARRVVSDDGELRLSFAPKPGARLISERAFRRRLGLEPAFAPDDLASHSEDQVARHSGLSASQLRTLSLFDVLSPVDGSYTYADLVAARAIGQLHASGVKIPKIVAAAIAFERRGKSLASVRLAEAPWGEVLQVLEGALAGVDGQLLLPLEGRDIDADGAFALAETSEEEGDFDAARRWYELAGRLDPTDPVVPFNLGNVLDELGRTREAEIAYRQAIAREPDMADAWFNLGVLQDAMGREADALASYARAFKSEPAYSDALHNAALLHMRRREFDAALRLLERILSGADANAAEIRRLAHLCRLEANAAETDE